MKGAAPLMLTRRCEALMRIKSVECVIEACDQAVMTACHVQPPYGLTGLSAAPFAWVSINEAAPPFIGLLPGGWRLDERAVVPIPEPDSSHRDGGRIQAAKMRCIRRIGTGVGQ